MTYCSGIKRKETLAPANVDGLENIVVSERGPSLKAGHLCRTPRPANPQIWKTNPGLLGLRVGEHQWRMVVIRRFVLGVTKCSRWWECASPPQGFLEWHFQTCPPGYQSSLDWVQLELSPHNAVSEFHIRKMCLQDALRPTASKQRSVWVSFVFLYYLSESQKQIYHRASEATLAKPFI